MPLRDLLRDLRHHVGGLVSGRVILSWPALPLWPNSRGHWAGRSRAVATARREGWALMREAGLRWPADAHLRLTFRPPSARTFDLDNALAACKAAIDGMADASGIDDRSWSYTAVKGLGTRGGQVIVERIPSA